MINFKELKNVADFEELNKGDFVAVEWRRDVPTNKRGTKKTRFSTYEVFLNKSKATEIILNGPLNIYFNYSMVTNPEAHGISNVKSILLLTATGVES
jgi:hypothetical protein